MSEMWRGDRILMKRKVYRFGEEPDPMMLTLIPEGGVVRGKSLYKCDCGNRKRIRTNHVNSGRVKSCGCLFKHGKAAKRRRQTAIDMSGQRFGSLKVLARCKAPEGNHQTGAFWYCECACGNRVKVYGGSLRAGKTKSCGHCGAKI